MRPKFQPNAGNVCFKQGLIPQRKSIYKVYSIVPIKKGMDLTLLVYEKKGEPLLLENGFQLRALALECTIAHCVKWVIDKACVP